MSEKFPSDHRHRRDVRLRRTSSWFSSLFLGLALVMGFHILCSTINPVSVSASNRHELTNNKLFTHSRPANPYDDNVSFFSRLREITAKKQQQEQTTTPRNSKGKSSKSKSKGKKKQKGQRIKGSFNRNDPSHTYYQAAYPIPNVSPTKFIPQAAVPVPTRIHPLAVLKTEIKTETNEPESDPGTVNNGRSNLYDVLDDGGKSNELLMEADDTNFFKNFRDHSEDPIAQESIGGSGPYVTYVRPEFPIPTGTSPFRLTTIDNTRFRTPENDQQQLPFTLPTKYTMTNLHDPGYAGMASADHRNPSYWPQKLNSYYGDEFTSHYMDQMEASRKPIYASTEEFHEFQGVNTNSNSIKKVSMIDRVSTLYTDYKLYAWIGLVVIATFTLLGALIALYLKNPPTEVVLARNSLARQLTDPTFLNFISEALKKFEQSDLLGSGKRKRRKERRKRT